MQRLWSRRSHRVFSHVLTAVTLVVTLVLAVVMARAGLATSALTLVIGMALMLVAHNSHRLRHRIGSGGRGDDLLRLLEAQGGEFDFERRPVAESAFDAGRVLWRLGVAGDARVSDAVLRRDGAVAFVAHHEAVEQIVAVPVQFLPTVRIDETRDRELISTRTSGHLVQTDDAEFATWFAGAEALAHIEATDLGRVTLIDGLLISRSPDFVDGMGFDQRVRDLRQLLRAMPVGLRRRFSREEQNVTRLRASL